MRTTYWALGLLAGYLVGLAGCKKAEEPVRQVQDFGGVKVEWLKLDTEFADAGPKVQAAVSLVRHAFRYGQLGQAVVELETLAKDPNLTDPQRKLVKDLLEQTKQAMAKAPPPER